jgi:23S rRNA pseudouridine1911/1915/1917 synthase
MNGTFTVTPGEAGARLDKFLAGAERLGSRRRATDALEKGKVFLNRQEVSDVDASRRLAAGDEVRIWMDRPGSARRLSQRPPRPGELPIVYEDDSLVVVNKPPGLLTVPLPRRHEAPSVETLLGEHFRSKSQRRPFVVHRIDRDTSGLVVFATNPGAQTSLKDQFRRHEATRIYLAVVYGVPSPDRGVWRDRLVWDQQDLIQKATHIGDPRGSDATCEYEIVEAFRGAALLQIRLQTGRRNQIRLQARLRGHTLLGEQRYVYGPQTLRPVEFSRQALHAWKLEFQHPRTARAMRFEAPLADDMVELVGRFRSGAAAYSLD